jgi:hypothetical protein
VNFSVQLITKCVILIAGLFIVSCSQTSLREPICTADSINGNRIPKELEGTYRLTLESIGSGIDLEGIAKPESFVFQISSSPAEIRVVNLSTIDTQPPKPFLSDTAFCQVPDFGYVSQRFLENTHTWDISKVVIQKNGFSIVPLGFHPDLLSKNNIRFLLIDSAMWGNGDGEDMQSSSSMNMQMIIDNKRKATGEDLTPKELLSLAQPLSIGISFTRVAETENLRRIFKSRGKNLNLTFRRSLRR